MLLRLRSVFASAVSAHEVVDAFTDEVTEEIGDFIAGGISTDLVLVIIVLILIHGAKVTFFREQLFVLSGQQRLVFARVIDFEDVAFITVDAAVHGDGIARHREAADGSAGHVDGTASNEFFSAALKAVEGDGHGAGLLGLNGEKSRGGEGDCGEERE